MDKWDQHFPRRQEKHWSRSNCGRKELKLVCIMSFTFIWQETILKTDLSTTHCCEWKLFVMFMCLKPHFTFSQCCSFVGPFFAFLCWGQSVTSLYHTEVKSAKFFTGKWGLNVDKKNVIRYLRNRSGCYNWMKTYLKPLLSYSGNIFQYPHR